MNIEEMKRKVRDLKKIGYEAVLKANHGHLGGSFSCAEFLVVLYYSGMLKYDSKNPSWEGRDYFILSKGHANNFLFPLLADVGFFPQSEIENYGKNGTLLGGHCEPTIPGMEIITGSLGHGLGIVAGMALANKIDGKNNHFYVLVGDGESQEGSIWEALMFISKHNLMNLTVIFDNNGLSSEDYINDTSALQPLSPKLQSFGFDAISVDGHNLSLIIDALEYNSVNKPKAIILKTIKGKGLSTVENLPKSHHTLPRGEDVETCRRSLENE